MTRRCSAVDEPARSRHWLRRRLLHELRAQELRCLFGRHRFEVRDRGYATVPITTRERFTLLAVRSVFDVLRGTPLHDDVLSVLEKLEQQLDPDDLREQSRMRDRIAYVPDGGTKAYADKEDVIDALQTGIIVFSEKIKACSAQRGFFMAPDFTADARAQAALDPRVELVTATATEMADVQAITYFHFLEINYKDVYIDFFEEPGAPQSPGPKKTVDIKAAKATLDGNSISLEQYVLAWRDEAQDQRTAKWGSPLQPTGEYELVAESERTFDDGRLVVDGVSYLRATLKVEMVARIHRPGVRARVDVDGRGSALKLEIVRVGEGEVQAWIVSGQPGVQAGDL